MNYEEMKITADNIDTPAYVFNKEDFLRRVQETRNLLGNDINMCFSIKANPFLIDPIFRNMDYFDKYEVCSIGELRICKKCNIPAKMVLFSGVNKRESEIEEAYYYGVRLFTIESYNHLVYISNIGKKYNDVLYVLIRISADTQFGMDEKNVEEIIDNRENYPCINILGIHYFTGTQKKSYEIIIREVEFLKDFYYRMQSKYDFKIKMIEYGPGLGADYFLDQKSGANSIKVIIPILEELASITELTIEMGRYFAATCGYYFTKVVDSKLNNGTNYAIVDGGMNQLHYDGQVKSMKVPYHTHIRIASSSDTNNELINKWTICGSICSTEDVVCRDVEYIQLQEGDILVFHNSGAYSYMEAMSTFLSREMPKIYARTENGKLHLLREFINTDCFNSRK